MIDKKIKTFGDIAREANNEAWQNRTLGCHGRWEATAQAVISAYEAGNSIKKSMVDEVVEAWNKTKLTKCSKLTSKRQTHLKARLKDTYWRENWKGALAIIASSPFCCGQNDRGWIADIDWFIRSDEALVKALEGKYSAKKAMSALTPKAPEPVVCKYEDGE